MSKLTTLALGLALCAASACSNDNATRREAERAADRVNDKTKEVKEEAQDLAEKSRDEKQQLAAKASDVAVAVTNETKDLAKAAQDLDEAQGEFAYHKTLRIRTLRAVHAIAGSQPDLINALATSSPLIDEDRTRVMEKLTLLRSRLVDSARLIQELEGVDATTWVARERLVADAMNRVEDARTDAWDALDSAKVDESRTSMR